MAEPRDPRPAVDLHRRLLDALQDTDGLAPALDELARALRAVVELHKPELFGGIIGCLACSPGMPPPILVEWSSCATIKAIADQLGVERPVVR